MGVVYKLTHEVLLFIVQTKKDNPKMSCRKLAAAATEQFHTKVSKSSVNAVLKKEGISGSVGRPYGKPAKDVPQKFYIPLTKKQQLQEILSNLGFQPDNKKEINQIIKEKSHSGTASEGKRGTEAKASINVGKDEGLSFTSSSNQKTILFKNNAGCVFVKSAFDVFFAKGFWGDFLKQELALAVEDDFGLCCDLWIQLKALGISSLEDLKEYDSDVFFAVNKISKWPDFYKAYQSLEKAVIPNGFSGRFQTQLEQASVCAYGVKILFSDGRKWIMDARLKKILAETTSLREGIPFHHVMSLISSNIIMNRKSILFRMRAGGEGSFADQALFMSALEEGEISEISVLDQDMREIASFNIIPHKKRKAAGVCFPGDLIFEQILAGICWPEVNQREYKDDVLNYKCKIASVGSYKIDDVSLNGFWIWQNDEQNPQCLVLANSDLTDGEIIRNSFLCGKDSGLIDMCNMFKNKIDREKLEIISTTIHVVFDILAQFLNKCAQKVIFNNKFNTNQLISDVYKKRGVVADVFGVSAILLEKNENGLENLMEPAARVNEISPAFSIIFE